MQFFSLARALFVAAVAVAIVIAGSAAPVRGSASRATTVLSTGLVTDAGAVPSGIPAHPVAGAQTLHLSVTLRPADPAGLAALLGQLSDPSSSAYRHFVTEPQFLARFSPAVSTDTMVEGYFASYGGQGFQTTPDRFVVSFALPASGASRALGVSFAAYRIGPVESFTAVGTAHLPADLAGSIASISGLSGTSGPRVADALLGTSVPRLVGASPDSWVTDGAGLGEPWFLGSDFTSSYHISSLFPPFSPVANATFPNRSAVATILMSGYNSTNDTDLPPYDPVVVQSYFNDTFPSSWPHPVVSGVPVNVSGVMPPAPGYFNGSNDSTANSIENSLDLEMAGSTAPGATIVNFYFSGSLFSSPRFTESLGQIADDFSQCLAAALAHNYSPARLSAVSGSFGLTDLNDTAWDNELMEAAATGVTVVSASGDQGNAPNDVSGRFQGQWPSWPASAAFNTYGVVAVGGTSVTLDGGATQVVGSNYTLNATFDPTVTEVLEQTAWYDTLAGFGNVSGSEGGISQVYVEPSWQFVSAAQPAIVNVTVEQGYGSLGRAEPDVAFPANTTIAYVARNSTGIYYEVVEGTSIAAPLFAGMLATWSAVSGHDFGYLDPELYRIASFFANASAAGSPAADRTPFLDVTQGSNYVFSAAPGWDGATGWGGLDGVLFLEADANSTIANYAYTGPTPGLPPPLAVGPGTLDQYVLLFIGIAIATVVVIVITVGTRRPTMPPPTVYGPGTVGAPWSPSAGYGGSPGALPPPAPGTLPRYSAPAPLTFLCPYCNAPRPAEPVRCPACGRM